MSACRKRGTTLNLVFLVSILLKGVGAILEILLQILITRELGVSGYGTYSTWINAADLLFWVLFSGLAKCNTFYLSGKDTTISRFKSRYYFRYVLPVLLALAAGLLLLGQGGYCLVLLIAGLELLVLDRSSTLIARGRHAVSLVGEYILGRLVLVAGVLVLGFSQRISVSTLIVLFAAQYGLVLAFYLVRTKRKNEIYRDISGEVSLGKWATYQRSDIVQAMISQMPVVIQYFFSGAFEAGVVSIVLLVKKLINFISGPTAKIFLPEFSRLYRENRPKEIRDCFASIMRIQMLFVGPLAVVLVGYPRVILNILAPELVSYAFYFILCSGIFLVAATLGPCGGVMQMTGNEKQDNRLREAALVAMILVMLLLRQDKLFVLYGLCIQTTLEAVSKYIFVCRWMKKAPVGLKTYLSWWLLPAAVIAGSYLLELQDSFWAMAACAGLVFLAAAAMELRRNKTLPRRRGA